MKKEEKQFNPKNRDQQLWMKRKEKIGKKRRDINNYE
jgi:hypothetical protein